MASGPIDVRLQPRRLSGLLRLALIAFGTNGHNDGLSHVDKITRNKGFSEADRWRLRRVSRCTMSRRDDDFARSQLAYDAGPAVITRGHLPAFSQLSFGIFDLKKCVDLSQSKTERLRVPFFLFRGGGSYGNFKKNPVDILAKTRGNKSRKNEHHR